MQCMDKDIESIATQMRKGVLEPCVLALLDVRPRYGTELAKRLKDSELIASEGTLYPLLARLRRQGLAKTTWEPSTAGPPRRYYTLTAEGRKRVRAFRTVWQTFSINVDQLLAEEP